MKFELFTAHATVFVTPYLTIRPSDFDDFGGVGKLVENSSIQRKFRSDRGKLSEVINLVIIVLITN